jgi:hypothetical protein
MTLLQLLTNHSAPPAGPSPYRLEFLREQRVLLPVAGLPGIVRPLLTGGK